MDKAEELANREFSVSCAEAALDFIFAIGGIDVVGVSSPIDGSLALFRQDLRRAFAVRNPEGVA